MLTLKEQKLKDRLVKDYSNRNNDRKKPNDEFAAFVRLLKALIEDKDIKDEKAIQISNKLMELGPNELSVYEWKHFYEYGVGKMFFVDEPCANSLVDVCKHDIPWEDMFTVYNNMGEKCISCETADERWENA
ncbi:hypothetical protein [Bacillus nitratireducens]|uniref:hypothetical protein n=1 Tax=Bacillus nitratireducens TaxID=2026193 RepID=UPI00300B8667